MFRTLLALLVSIGMVSGIAASQIASASSPGMGATAISIARTPSMRAPATKHQVKPGRAFPTCPPAGIPPAQPSPATGHHTVILSWNASVPSPTTPNPASGYCLYRSSADKDTLQKTPTCVKCQQVNTVPVAGTSCVDDLVANQTNYYYVVTAINAQGVPSLPSNEASASIPDDKPGGSAAAGSTSPPLCRVSTPVK